MTKVTILLDAQARIRRLLHDPSAELLVWSGNPVWAYVDADGKIRAG